MYKIKQLEWFLTPFRQCVPMNIQYRKYLIDQIDKNIFIFINGKSMVHECNNIKTAQDFCQQDFENFVSDFLEIEDDNHKNYNFTYVDGTIKTVNGELIFTPKQTNKKFELEWQEIEPYQQFVTSNEEYTIWIDTDNECYALYDKDDVLFARNKDLSFLKQFAQDDFIKNKKEGKK